MNQESEFSQIEIDQDMDSTNESQSLSQKRKRCPRENCPGSLFYNGVEFVCNNCQFTQNFEYEESQQIVSRMESQSRKDLELEKKKKNYLNPRRRRLKGIKKVLLEQINFFEKKFYFEGKKFYIFRSKCLKMYKFLKNTNYRIPNWVCVFIIYCSFFSIHPFFISDLCDFMRFRIIPYGMEWKKIHEVFIEDINHEVEMFQEVENVEVRNHPIPLNVSHIWCSCIHFFGDYLKEISTGFRIEDYLKELINRIMYSNSNICVVNRKIIYEKTIELLKKNYKNHIIDEFDTNDKVLKTEPPEVSLFCYVLTAFMLIYQKNDELFIELINDIRNSENFFKNNLRIDENKFIEVSKGFYTTYLRSKLCHYLKRDHSIELLANKVFLNNNYVNTQDFESSPVFITFPFRNYKKKNKNTGLHYVQSFQKEVNDCIFQEKESKMKTLKSVLIEYDEEDLEMLELYNRIKEKSNDRMFEEVVFTQDENWKFIFDLIQFKVGMNIREFSGYLTFKRHIKFKIGDVIEKLRILFNSL